MARAHEAELKSLIDKAHSCNVKVIADVLFNHIANLNSGDNYVLARESGTPLVLN